MKKIVILCAGDFGKEVAWLINDINKVKLTYDLIGFLDDDAEKTGKTFNGYICLGPLAKIVSLNEEDAVWAIIATQNSSLRKRIVEMFPDFHNWETVIHPSVNIADTSTLGQGCIICANCNISVNTSIGNHCIMNLGTTVGHDCKIKDYVSLMSGAVISGHVIISEGAYFGSNATVLPKKKVGRFSTVGAGSVVIRNVKDNVSVMGVPATVLKI